MLCKATHNLFIRQFLSDYDIRSITKRTIKGKRMIYDFLVNNFSVI